MTRRQSWGWELEAYQRRERRREAIRTIALIGGMMVGATVVLVVGWLAMVGFLVIYS